MIVEKFQIEQSDEWDAFVKNSNTSLFLLTRKFLSYHGERFCDRSIMIKSDAGKLLAVLPASENPNDKKEIVSHLGVTYGGFIVNSSFEIQTYIDSVTAALEYYFRNGYNVLKIKGIPVHLHRSESGIESWVLKHLDANLDRVDFWNIIDLADIKYRERTKRQLKKGNKFTSKIELANYTSLCELYAIIEENLNSRHQTKPVHSLEELKHLINIFPENIYPWVIKNNTNKTLGGIIIFDFGYKTAHAQYIASSQEGRNFYCLTTLIDFLISRYQKSNYRYLSLGASSEANGTRLNNGLVQFKSGFSSSSVTAPHYSLRTRLM